MDALRLSTESEKLLSLMKVVMRMYNGPSEYIKYEEELEGLAKLIHDKETFETETRDISMEELIIYIHWISIKQIGAGGERYAIELDEYNKLLKRVDLEYKNEALNEELYPEAEGGK